MSERAEFAARSRAMIDQGAYMTLATADAAGIPWASPVWYAPESYASLLWVSSLESRHSRNLEARAELAVVIFDSRAPVATGEAVSFDATAEVVGEAELEAALTVFSRRLLAQGGPPVHSRELQDPSTQRLYRARALQVYFSVGDRRVEVALT
jgi:nitroimidazol reductase NimA-like FMN-containing flavoprotein (pyridoxamine 5'-phosphate oxidase superfamily)